MVYLAAAAAGILVAHLLVTMGICLERSPNSQTDVANSVKTSVSQSGE